MLVEGDAATVGADAVDGGGDGHAAFGCVLCVVAGGGFCVGLLCGGGVCAAGDGGVCDLRGFVGG